MIFFKLFASNIPVKGAKRSVICDLSRGDIYYISKGLYEFLTEYEDIPYQDILDNNSREIQEVIKKEVSFLLKNELGFFTDKPQKFPKLDLSWDFPAKISNAIIEHNKLSNYDLKYVCSQLDKLGCKFIELRFYDSYSLSELENFMNHINSTYINSLKIYIRYNPNWNRSNILKIVSLFPRILHLHIFGSNLTLNENESRVNRITYYTEIINDNSCCGNIHFENFSVGVNTFSETQKYNSCLNRKVSISPNGDIKNCPSIPKTYGNVKTSQIKDEISKDFKKYWDFKKDDIEICRDCEFRYICTDCRGHISDPNNPLSKPEKCKYDPYTATWE